MIKDKWIADESFIFEDSGVFSITGRRYYYKKNKGKAIVVVVRGSHYTYPCLLSTNPEYVENYCSYDPSYIGYFNATIEYLGLTWYFAIGAYGWLRQEDSSGYAPIIITSLNCEDSTQIQEIALMVLKTANIELTYSQQIYNYIKDVILNNKLFQEYCIPYEEE